MVSAGHAVTGQGRKVPSNVLFQIWGWDWGNGFGGEDMEVKGF